MARGCDMTAPGAWAWDRSSMIAHQDHRFPGVQAGDGLKIDFDKDADSKRNAAHARDQKAQKSKEEAALRLPREVPGAPLGVAGIH